MIKAAACLGIPVMCIFAVIAASAGNHGAAIAFLTLGLVCMYCLLPHER